MIRNLFELKDRLLAAKLVKHGSMDGIYSRGADSINCKVILGMKLLRVDDGMGGVRIVWTDMDVLIPAADLSFLLVLDPPNPDRHDLLQIVLPYESPATFEVFPMDSEPAWRWADPHHNMYRIHMKHVADFTYV